MQHKLYVVVEAGLSKSQQAVQAAHGVAEFMLDSRVGGEWGNETLVLLRDKGLEKYLGDCDCCFREPDLGGMVTAVVFLGRCPGDLPLL